MKNFLNIIGSYLDFRKLRIRRYNEGVTYVQQKQGKKKEKAEYSIFNIF